MIINKNISHPNYWNNLYLNKESAWDLKMSTLTLIYWLKKNNVNDEKICIPGCGYGYDAIELASKGAMVWGVDFANEPINFLKEKSKKLNININTICDDIFNLKGEYSSFFSMVWEYTCYCAINPERRKEYRDLVYQILSKGGKLICLFYPILKKENGDPPFAVNLEFTLELFN